MLRNEWEFEFAASKLAKAASDKRAHHQELLKFWEETKAKVMAEVKESGIEVNESLAVQYSSSNASREPQVMVRNDLQIKLTECHQKIREHLAKSREYGGWMQVMEAAKESRFKLHADDYLYFFGVFK